MGHQTVTACVPQVEDRVSASRCLPREPPVRDHVRSAPRAWPRAVTDGQGGVAGAERPASETSRWATDEGAGCTSTRVTCWSSAAGWAASPPPWPAAGWANGSCSPRSTTGSVASSRPRQSHPTSTPGSSGPEPTAATDSCVRRSGTGYRTRPLVPTAAADPHLNPGQCWVSATLHPVEWSIGEAAGALAAFSRRRAVEPADVHGNGELTTAFQRDLRRLGVQLSWPEEIAVQPR